MVGAAFLLTERQNAQPLHAVQCGCIAVVQRLFVVDKIFQTLQLGQAQAGLHVGHAVVVAHLIVQKLQYVGLGLGGQMLGVLGPVSVVGHDHAARTGGDDLVAVEAVTADIADGARKLTGKRPGGAAGAQGLGGILNQNQVIALGNGRQAGHIGHVAENMDDFQRLDVGAGLFVVQLIAAQLAVVRTEILHRVGVNAQAVVAANENRLGPHIAGQRVDGGDKGQRRHNDLVPAGDARRHCGQVQRAGTGVAGHGAGHAHVGGQRFLKLRDFAAAGGDPPRRDGLSGQLGLAHAEIRNRKRNKSRHNNASIIQQSHRNCPADRILQIFYFIIPLLRGESKKKMGRLLGFPLGGSCLRSRLMRGGLAAIARLWDCLHTRAPHPALRATFPLWGRQNRPMRGCAWGGWLISEQS